MFDAHRFQIQRHVGDEIRTNRRNRRIFCHSAVISRITDRKNNQLVVLLSHSGFEKLFASDRVVDVCVSRIVCVSIVVTTITTTVYTISFFWAE